MRGADAAPVSGAQMNTSQSHNTRVERSISRFTTAAAAATKAARTQTNPDARCVRVYIRKMDLVAAMLPFLRSSLRRCQQRRVRMAGFLSDVLMELLLCVPYRTIHTLTHTDHHVEYIATVSAHRLCECSGGRAAAKREASNKHLQTVGKTLPARARQQRQQRSTPSSTAYTYNNNTLQAPRLNNGFAGASLCAHLPR